MARAIPTYFRSGNLDADRRTTEQDDFNREVNADLTSLEDLSFLLDGDSDLAQIKDFVLFKTTNPVADFRFRHNFGVIATHYGVLNVRNNGGGSSSVDHPVRTASAVPTAGVDDAEFLTLTFSGRGDYLIRVQFDSRLAREILAGNIEGPS